MATWGEHPEAFKGYLYIHRPAALISGQINEAGGITYPVDVLDYDNSATSYDLVTPATISRVATVSFGSAAEGWEKGFCSSFTLDTTGSTLTLPYPPQGIRPGEINIADDDWFTLWWDYRPWFLSPKLYDYLGRAMYTDYKGRYASNFYPFALNLGAAVYDWSSSGVWSGVFSWADSDAPLCGGTKYDEQATTPTDGMLSVSSTNGANVKGNMVDGDTGTYWESTGVNDETITLDYGDGTEQALLAIGMTPWAGYGVVTFEIAWSNDDVTYTPIDYYEPKNPVEVAPTTTAYFMTTNPPIARYWKITLSSGTGATYRISRLAAYIDDGWNLGFSSSTFGTYTDSTLLPTGDGYTIEYPIGFSWIHIQAKGTATGARAIRPVCILDENEWIASVVEATIGTGAANAFDGNLATYLSQSIFVTPYSADIKFPSMRMFKAVRITCSDTGDNYGPEDFTIQVKNSRGSYATLATITGETWDGQETKEYALDPAGAFGQEFRVNITSVVSGTTVRIAKIEYIYQDRYGFSKNKFEVVSHTITQQGQQMTFRVYDDLSYYPQGTLIMYREDEYYKGVKGSLAAADPTDNDREGLVFWGWVDQTQSKVSWDENGKYAYTDLVCYDVAGWAAKLPFTSFVYLNDNPGNIWGGRAIGLVNQLTVDATIFHILADFSTITDFADFFSSGHYGDYRISAASVATGNIFNSADGMAQKIAHRLTFNKMGQFKVVPDQNLQQSGDRSGTSLASIGPTDIQEFGYTRIYSSRVGRAWGNAIQISAADYENSDASKGVFFCVAPDIEVWGQGVQQIEHGEQVVIDQTELNNREGQRYAAYLNTEYGNIELILAHGGDTGIDPAHGDPILLTITDANKAPDGFTCTDKRAYPIKMSVKRNQETGTKEVKLVVELEVDGVAAQTYTPPS